jgi:hypothetical protein
MTPGLVLFVVPRKVNLTMVQDQNLHTTLTADVANTKMKESKYIEHITEAEPEAPKYGDKPVLQCEDCTGCPKCCKEGKIGNQSSEYYKN